MKKSGTSFAVTVPFVPRCGATPCVCFHLMKETLSYMFMYDDLDWQEES